MTTTTTNDTDNASAVDIVDTPVTTDATTIITILVLYGSQTGNSEQAAQEFCSTCTSEYLYTIYCCQQEQQQEHSKKNRISIITKCMSLDDFLEIYHCQWSPIVIIFVSSYGVGGPPLGSIRFRDICDYLLVQQQQQPKQQQQQLLSLLSLRGIHYAICGLGDSKYTTYFNNPTIIQQTLDVCHAHAICPIGRADASAYKQKKKKNIDTEKKSNSNDDDNNNNSGMEQSEIIQEWVTNLWKPLCQIVYNGNNNKHNENDNNHNNSITVTKEELQIMQQQTIAICKEVIPDYIDPTTIKKKNMSSSFWTTTATTGTTILSILIVLLAIMVLYFVQ